MPKTIVYDTPRIVEWVKARQPLMPNWHDAVAIGLQQADGELVGGVVYENFGLADVNMHVCGEGNWLTREFLIRVFYYPFIECKLRRVTALVASRNQQTLRFCSSLGFQYEGRARHALPDDDVIIFGMLRAECRFIPQEPSQ
jgi:RimJ/RimL family protein N-acetyltransferase